MDLPRLSLPSAYRFTSIYSSSGGHIYCFTSASSSAQRIRFTSESQNHRMVGVGRDLCGSPSPTLLPKQGHLQHTAEDLVQAGFEYLQRRRLHSLTGQPGPGLCHPQGEEVLSHGKLTWSTWLTRGFGRQSSALKVTWRRGFPSGLCPSLRAASPTKGGPRLTPHPGRGAAPKPRRGKENPPE